MVFRAQFPRVKGRRYVVANDIPQPGGLGVNGRPFCRICHEEVPKRHRVLCGEDCRIEMLRLLDPVGVVRKRDKGICQICKLDTLWFGRIFEHVHNYLDDDLGFRLSGTATGEILKSLGWSKDTFRIPYDIDHIMPIVLGGEHHPDNMRTVCQPCHKGETYKLRQELVNARKNQGGCDVGS